MIGECLTSHVESLVLQESQAYMADMVDQGYADYLVGNTDAYTIRAPGGRLLACVGLGEMWAGRGYVWMLVDKDAGAHMVTLVKDLISLADRYAEKYPRIECAVDEGFDAGHRLVRMCGFELETLEPMKKYFGEISSYLYARVR